jgi:hypothetical protein
MEWSKATNYMLTMCVYRQSTPTGNNERKINWDAVVDLVNATFTRFPSFVLSYPNGVTSHRLQGQYGGRHRPHATRPTEHTVSHWALEHDTATVAEEAEFTSHLDDLVEAERILDLDPNSSVAINTEKPRIWWIEFNVAAFKRDYHAKYPTDYSAEDGSDSQGSQDGEEGQEDEEMDDDAMEYPDEEMQDVEDGDQEEDIVYEEQEQPPAGSDAPSSPGNAFATVTSNALDDNAHSIGQGDSDTSKSIPALIKANSNARRPRALAGTRTSIRPARRLASVARTRPGQDRLSAEENSSARNGLGPAPMDHFTRLISRLNSWPEIPMVHTKKVDRNSALSMISTQFLLSGPVSPEEIFVSSNAPANSFMGRVHRIWFNDHTTDQWAEVDVLICDERHCDDCHSRSPLPPLLQQRQTCPLVHEDDLAMVPHQGLTFQPGGRIWELNNMQSGHSYVQYVTFTGGKRVLVDVVSQSDIDASSAS